MVIGGPAGRWLRPADRMFAALALAPLVSQRLAPAIIAASPQSKRSLLTLTGLIEDGKITPVIDRYYPFGEIPAAISYHEEGHAQGKVVVTV